MHKLGPGLIAAFAASLCAPLSAADDPFDVFNDFRLDVGAVPVSRPVQEGIHQTETSGPDISANQSLGSLGLGIRVDLGWYKALTANKDYGTIVVGLSIFDAQQSGDPNNPAERGNALTGPIKLNAMGVDISVAYAIPVTRNFHIEIGPFIGVGTATISDSDLVPGSTTVTTEQSAHGVYREMGGRLWFIYTSRNNNFQAHLAIAYYGAHAAANIQFNTSVGTLSDNLTIDESGVSPSIGFGYRF
jgi:hypothetical protein